MGRAPTHHPTSVSLTGSLCSAPLPRCLSARQLSVSFSRDHMAASLQSLLPRDLEVLREKSRTLLEWSCNPDSGRRREMRRYRGCRATRVPETVSRPARSGRSPIDFRRGGTGIAASRLPRRRRRDDHAPGLHVRRPVPLQQHVSECAGASGRRPRQADMRTVRGLGRASSSCLPASWSRRGGCGDAPGGAGAVRAAARHQFCCARRARR